VDSFRQGFRLSLYGSELANTVSFRKCCFLSTLYALVQESQNSELVLCEAKQTPLNPHFRALKKVSPPNLITFLLIKYLNKTYLLANFAKLITFLLKYRFDN
jgi:hypothetical protein